MAVAGVDMADLVAADSPVGAGMADLAAEDVEEWAAADSPVEGLRVPADSLVRGLHALADLVLPDVLPHSATAVSVSAGRQRFGAAFSCGILPSSVLASHMTTDVGDVFGLAGAGAGSPSATEICTDVRRLRELNEMGACL